MSEKQLVLQATDISIVFGGLRAVSDLNMEIYKGELIGLIGPNGAGKTTLFNMLSGVYTPTSGQIAFWDKNDAVNVVNRKTPAELNRIGIARTFQNIRLFGNLSVADNVKIAMHGQRKSNPFSVLFRTKKFLQEEFRVSRQVFHLLKLFGLEKKENELASNLPYGEQRKLEICRALASKPSLLLLDEPAAGMNPQETAELMDLISFIRKEFNLTILLIEHDMKLVMGICERLYVLNYGRVLAEGTPEKIQKNPEVIKAYLGTEAEAVNV